MSTPADAPPSLRLRAKARLSAVRADVRARPGGHLVWRIGVTFVGALVVAIGIVLLPLPGPGWLIIFTGLGILATEYPWASRLLARSRRMVTSWTLWLADRSTAVRVLIGVVSVVFLVAVLVACWLVVRTL